MKENSYQMINTYLGNHQERYFSNGFKHFNFTLQDLSAKSPKLEGKIAVSYNGPKRPRDEAVHLGSLEYTAVSLHIIEHALQELLGLGITEISRSIPVRLSFKNSKEILLTTDVLILPFTCILIENNLDLQAQNIGMSRFKIRVLSAKIEITVDHPCSNFIHLPQQETLAFKRTVFQSNYQKSSISIAEISLQEKKETIRAKIFPTASTKQASGICSSKAQILATDYIAITGQLMQVLLYQILNTQRKDCPNIFLRSMTLHFAKIKMVRPSTISISFTQRKELVQNHDHWHIINLESKLAHISGEFNICHKLPKFP